MVQSLKAMVLTEHPFQNGCRRVLRLTDDIGSGDWLPSLFLFEEHQLITIWVTQDERTSG